MCGLASPRRCAVLSAAQRSIAGLVRPSPYRLTAGTLPPLTPSTIDMGCRIFLPTLPTDHKNSEITFFSLGG